MKIVIYHKIVQKFIMLLKDKLLLIIFCNVNTIFLKFLKEGQKKDQIL